MNSDDLKEIWDKFTKKVDSDDKLRRLYKLAEEGNASYEDARTLSSVFSDIIVDSAVDVCPGQVEEITEALKDDLLGKRYYKELNGYVSKVQKSYNESLGLGINPVDVSTNRNLIPKDFEPVEDYQKAISSLRRQTELSSNKFVDHVQRKNAAFQSNDFDVTVSRTYDRVGLSEGRTCKWCLARTGKNVPYDLAVKMGMFERHEGCHCEIEYNNNGIKTYQSGKGGRDSFKQRHRFDWMATKRHLNDKFNIKLHELKEYKNICTQRYSDDARKMAEYLDKHINKTTKYGELSEIVIAKNESLHGIAAYDREKNILFISEELIDPDKFSTIVTDRFSAINLDDVLTHELLGHKAHWVSVQKYAEDKNISVDRAKTELESNLRKYVLTQYQNDPRYVKKIISENAKKGFDSKKDLNELIADAKVLISRNELNDLRLAELIEEVLHYDG